LGKAKRRTQRAERQQKKMKTKSQSKTKKPVRKARSESKRQTPERNRNFEAHVERMMILNERLKHAADRVSNVTEQLKQFQFDFMQ